MGIASVGHIIPGAYFQADTLVIPVNHWDTGKTMGWQYRKPGTHPTFSTGVEIRNAAPTAFMPLHTLVNPEVRPLLICEGPTDLIAAVEMRAISDFNLAACWSATCLPPKAFWERMVGSGTCVYAAGDGDKAGSEFNQRLADIFGTVYVVRMPEATDIKKMVTRIGGVNEFQGLLRAAAYRPLHRKKAKVWKRPMTFHPTGVDIVQLVEADGRRPRAKLSNGQLKYQCPLHEDSSPSLSVDPKTGSWQCWAGCGKGGPAQFIMRMKRCDYDRACEILRRYA